MGSKTSKLSCEKKNIFLSINKVLPAEMLTEILEKLDFGSLRSARLTCKYWKQLIDNSNVMEEAYSKIFES